MHRNLIDNQNYWKALSIKLKDDKRKARSKQIKIDNCIRSVLSEADQGHSIPCRHACQARCVDHIFGTKQLW